jgi:hypothetical protein
VFGSFLGQRVSDVMILCAAGRSCDDYRTPPPPPPPPPPSSCVLQAKLADIIQGLNANKEDRQLHESRTQEFISVLEKNEDAEALERFMDFEIDPLLLPLYEELDAILIEQEVSAYAWVIARLCQYARV